jgi:hypothetical protein
MKVEEVVKEKKKNELRKGGRYMSSEKDEERR